MEQFLTSKCSFDKNGVQINDVGTWCWIWIVINIISLFGYLFDGVNTIMDLKSKGKNNELKKVYIRTFLSTITSLLTIYFMYSMCKLCRAWTAFGILLLVSCLQLGAYLYFF